MVLKGKVKLAAGRRIARNHGPYFSRMIYGLAPVEVPGLGTFGVTDGMIMVYDPQCVEDWSIKKIGFVVLHEVCHKWLKHSDRAIKMGIPPDMNNPLAIIWNIAGDVYINKMLRQMFNNWAPDDALLPNRLPFPFGHPDPDMDPLLVKLCMGLELPEVATTEEAYLFLKKHLPKIPGGAGTLTQKGTDCPHCGSGAGRPLKDEPGKDHPGQRSKGEVQTLQKQVAHAIQKAAEKSRGTMPSELVAAALSVLEPPRIPWESRLARVARSAAEYTLGNVDYRWTRPSRRQAALGWGLGCPILPGTIAPKVAAWFVIDTSGSMSEDDMAIGIREMKGVMRAVGGDVHFVACDAQVHVAKQVDDWRQAARDLKGRGGTAFQPVFDLLKKTPKHKRPNVIVFCTDGYGDNPKPPSRDIRVIWLVTPGGQKPAEFGDVIKMEERTDERNAA